MRLFIAIDFHAEFRMKLAALRDELRMESMQGRFTPFENLHLTLAFLGECDDKQLAEAKSAMDRVEFKPFSIHIGRIGRFRRRGGDLWWAGVSENQPLTQLHAELTDNLREAGFQIEKRRFSPHITLGREIVTKASPRLIEKFGQTVESVKLMKSERIAGKMVYTSIYEKSSRSSSLLNQS